MSATTSSEQSEIRLMARALACRELMPRAAALDAVDSDALEQCWRLLLDTGLDRALLPEEHGGVGLGVPELLASLEELAVGDGGVAMCALLSNAALALMSEEELAAVGEGERWALALISSTSELVCWEAARLTGQIDCALACDGADGIVLLALDGRTPVRWVIPADSAGLSLSYDDAQLGLRAARAAAIAFEDVGVQAVDAVVGALDGVGAACLLYGGTAAIARGISRRAHEMAFEYAEARQQGGVAIIEYDAVSDMLTAMSVRLACHSEPAADGSGGRAGALAAKIAASDAAVASTTDAVQVFGGTGYMVETGVEKLMRDAKYCQLFPQSNWLAHSELMALERAGQGHPLS